ncbi:GAF and ANTAR domain-containing protein [Nesterenkonia haasae]|uniref:GAF and ANTAR domain-containing protein n=1 Tax=Nesterenkonia haasae TaxID=2587813 RepID=UPI001391EA04|nr:GAF and ANTAR domain-containing protein [Nesterenkonia haasae]NDK30241.1 GAF and ANTAR domain-containing protein [Nesterenkonia haasae]
MTEDPAFPVGRTETAMETLHGTRDFSAELSELLMEDHDIVEVLNSLAHLAEQRLSMGRIVRCGIVLERPRRNMVVASGSAEAKQMEETQTGFGEGPCLEAQRTETVIRIPDVRHEKRWAPYMEEVRRHGPLSVLAVPLEINTSATAAMNFYSYQVGDFADEALDIALEYAKTASTTVAIALRIAEHSETAEDRRRAMESRTTIDIAVGVIMGQNRCSQEKAVEILKKASNHRNIKLRELAEQIISTVGQSTPETSFDS